MTLTGTNFITSSTALWNGTPLTTSFSNSTTLTAQLGGADLSSAGSASVTVQNPSPGGGTSNAITFVISPTTTPGASIINVAVNDLAWDPVNQKIYLSLPSSVGTNGNSVQILDPATGNLGKAAFVGSEPSFLSVSQNSQFLYVGLNGASNVQRMTLPALGTDVTIPLGADSFNGPFYAMDVQAAPNGDGTVAVVRGTPNVSPAEEGGVVIYDNLVPRPDALCGFIQSGCTSGGALYDSIQWNGDGSEMFAANNEDTGFDFYTIPVTAAGFGAPTVYGGVVQGFFGRIHFDRTTGYAYDDNGVVINPANGTLVGTFNASGLMVPDGTLTMAYFLGQTQSNFGSGIYTLESFDLNHFTPIATLTFKNIVGTPRRLIRWGSNGLAFATSGLSASGNQVGAVYIITGSFVQGTSNEVSARPTENVRRSWQDPKVRPSGTQWSH